MPPPILFWPLTAILFLSICQTILAASDDVLAEVNGSPITRQMYDDYLAHRQVKKDANTSSDPQSVLRELVGQELIYQDAVKQGLDKDAEVLRRLEMARRNLIISAALSHRLEKEPVSDAAVKRAYERLIKAQTGKEYKARHILTKTEEEAKAVIATLNKGADFAELAKTKSIGPSSKDGGALGWFRPEQMVKPFSEATAALAKKTYTQIPVKTRFGWHVIKLEDIRDLSTPPLEQVTDQIKSLLQQDRLRNYVHMLHQGGEITLHSDKLPTSDQR